MKTFNFSVLLSLYYKESSEYLEQCLQSIWSNQKLKPAEILIVKDGPLTFELETVLNKWKDKLKNKLIVIPLKENVGLGKALNIGLTHCAYEWVFRMDTDDICTPDRFEKQVDFIHNHPDVDIFSGQILEFEGSINNITGKKAVPLHHNEIVDYSKIRSPFNHMAVAYKKSVIESVGGYKHHMYMEDYNLWLRVLSKGYKSANLNDNLVLVRAGNEMIKRRRGKVYIKSEWQLFMLKRDLGYQSTINALFFFTARSIPRLLPTNILTNIYSSIRTNSS